MQKSAHVANDFTAFCVFLNFILAALDLKVWCRLSVSVSVFDFRFLFFRKKEKSSQEKSILKAEENLLNMDTNLQHEDLLIKLRAKLNEDQVKLWEAPYYEVGKCTTTRLEVRPLLLFTIFSTMMDEPTNNIPSFSLFDSIFSKTDPLRARNGRLTFYTHDVLCLDSQYQLKTATSMNKHYFIKLFNKTVTRDDSRSL